MNTGTSINFDANALQSQDEAEFQKEEQQQLEEVSFFFFFFFLVSDSTELLFWLIGNRITS